MYTIQLYIILIIITILLHLAMPNLLTGIFFILDIQKHKENLYFTTIGPQLEELGIKNILIRMTWLYSNRIFF